MMTKSLRLHVTLIEEVRFALVCSLTKSGLSGLLPFFFFLNKQSINWVIDLSVCLQIVCGCFCLTKAELSSATETVWLAKLKIFSLWPFSVLVKKKKNSKWRHTNLRIFIHILFFAKGI